MRLMRSRRSSSGRFIRRSRLANPTRRRVRRVRRTAKAVRRTRHHSPAMRAKISRAVKAAMRRRHSGGGVVKSSRRRPARHSFRRRSSSGGGLYVIKGRKLNPPRFHRRRSFRRRSNPSGLSSIRGLLSKDVMWMAAGAITASIGTGFVMGKFGSMLPFSSSTYGMAAYQLAIPMAGAYVLRNKQRSFATGLVVGGVVMAITTIMKSGIFGQSMVVQGPMGNFYAVKGVGIAGELARSGTRSLGAYIGPKTYSSIPAAVNAPVFQSGAW